MAPVDPDDYYESVVLSGTRLVPLPNTSWTHIGDHYNVSNQTFVQEEEVSQDWQPWGYALAMLFGLPINGITFSHLLKKYRKSKSPLLLLHMSLNASDILATSVFCIGRYFWLTLPTWYGGDIFCKGMRYLDLFIMCLSSNAICCIAWDRLCIFTDRHTSSSLNRDHRKRRVIISIAMAWILAALCATPQLYFWSTIGDVNQTVVACLSDWGKEVLLLSSWNDTLDAPNALDDDWHYLSADIYNLYSVAVLFFIPFLFIVFCYARVLTYVSETLRMTTRRTAFSHIVANGNADDQYSMYSLTNQASLPRNELLGGQPVTLTTEVNQTPPTSKLSSQTMTNGNSARHHMEPAANGGIKKNGGSSPPDSPEHTRLKRARSHSMKVAVILGLVYSMTWLPYNSLVIWSVLHSTSFVKYEHLLAFLYMLIVLNSIINPFIYHRPMCFTWRKRPKNNRRTRRQKR